jgi:predicted ester cyclase
VHISAGSRNRFPATASAWGHTIESGNEVAVEGTWSGTHMAALVLPDGTSIPPTNKQVSIPFATMFRVRDGKILEHRGYWDMAGMMAQLQG